MSFNFEEFFKSIDVIVEQRLSDLSYDKTVIATIIDDSNKARGYYVVTDGTIRFDAYANDMNYKTDDQVRVTIMNGDWSQKKFIVGLYVDDGTNSAVTYVPPLSNVFQTDFSKSSVEKDSITSFTLLTNDTITSKPIWGKHIVPGSSEYTLQANGIYNVITLSGDFQTDLGSLKAGGYGLRLDLYIQPQVDSDERIVKFITFDSSEMIGNPYSFVIDSRQEKQVAIASQGIVTEIVLSVYQGVKYDDEGESTSNLFYNKDDALIDLSPIYFKNISIGFGSNLTDIEDNSLKIYTLDSTTYKYNGGNGDETNDKRMGLIWYNKTENDEYVGFSDGINQPDYDEIAYLKESYADSRLTKNAGKTSVADDELSLTLAANIQESEPLMTRAYEALTTDLASVLQALGRQIPGTSFLDELNTLISSWIDETEEDESLQNKPAKLIAARNTAEENVEKLAELYQEVLQYGYNKQNGIEDEWGSIDEDPWGTVDYYTNFKTAVEGGIKDVEDFFANMAAGTESDQISAGYRGIYNSYKTKADRVIKAIETNLSQIISSSTVHGETKEDIVWLASYETKTAEDLPSYTKKDLSAYEKKYCIYWYRYNEGYSLEYDTTEGANNDEYLFGRFLGDNWERIQVDKDGNAIINFGIAGPGKTIDGVEYMAASPLTEQLLTRRMDPKTEVEQYQVVLFYDHAMYKSNTLVFTNTEADEIPPEVKVDAADVIRIEHSTYSQDHYQSYSSANDLVNIADESRIRQLKCYYDGVLSSDETLAGAGLYWYIPVNSTMLTYDKNYLIKQGFVTDAEEQTSLSKSGYVYFYKEVGFTNDKVASTDSSGAPLLDAAGNQVYEDNIKITESDKYFFYKIKPYYESSAQNNTILVEAHIQNGEQTKITTGEISFTFSSFGTNGTKYTLVMVPNTTQISVLPSDEQNPNDPFDLKLTLRNAEGDPIEMSTDAASLPDGEADEIITYGLEVGWFAASKAAAGLTAEPIEESKSKLVTIANYYDPDTKYVGIVKAKVSFDEALSNGTNRRINLDTMYSVPFASSSDLYISGPTMIVYNNQGTVSRLCEEPYKLFRHTVDKGDVEEAGCTWSIVYYNNSGDLLTSTSYTEEERNAILAYMPKLNQDNTLMPAPVYCEFDDGTFMVPVVVCKQGDSILWTQPIIITQNNYASSTLNEWNGEFEINEENGTILSTMIGAGKKNTNNTFDGVLMGDIEAGANFDTDNASGLGIYGFNDGAQSFHFGIDGRAFLGKAGRGRIQIDGNEGTISSASYQQNRVPIYDDEGKITGYEKYGTAGMKIDLDDGYIDMIGTSPEDTENGQAYQSDGTQSNIHLDVISPYFTIRSANATADNKYIVYVANNEYYLESDTYKEASYPTPAEDIDASEMSDGEGMKIDLMNGSINSYQFSVTSKNVFLNAGNNATDYLSIRSNDGKVLLYLGDNAQFIKSNDFITQSGTYPGQGTKFDLSTGSIEAYDFNLRAGSYEIHDSNGTLTGYGHVLTMTTDGSSEDNPFLKITTSSGNKLLVATNSSFYLQSSNYSHGSSGLKLDINNGQMYAYGNFILQATGNGGTITINSGASAYPLQVGEKFKVAWSGAVTATGGTFTDITVNGNGTFAGNITSTATITGGTISGASVTGGSLDIGNGAFVVKEDGTLTIGGSETFNVTPSGELTCTSATIGGWKVSGGEGGFTAGSFSMTPTGLNFNDYLDIAEDGKTTITDLVVLKSATFKSSCTIKINTSSDGDYDLITAGDIWAGGHIGIYAEPDADYGLYVNGKSKIGGSLLFTGDLFVGSEDANHQGLDKTVIFYNGWKKHTLTFSKGVFIGLDGEFDTNEGGIPEYESGKFLSNNGSELVWKAMTVSNGTFKLGSGSNQTLTPTLSGNTATFTMTIPGQSYSVSGGTTSGHYVTVYANQALPAGYSIGGYEDKGSSWVSVGKVWASGESYSGGSGTTDARTATLKVTFGAT